MGGYVGIPTSYTPVEYIESSGTQYIDTGIIISKNNKMVIDTQFTRTDVFQINGTTEATRNDIGINNGNFFFGVSSTSMTTTQTADTNRHTFFIDCPNGSYGLDGNTLATVTPYTGADGTRNILLFARWATNKEAYCYEKMYSTKIYVSDVLVRDFVPALDSNNVACLYEKVEGKFYYNAGTGNFTAGSATGEPVLLGSRARKIIRGYVGVPASYTPVEYIESTGTQYIDTGFLPNSNTSVILEAKIPSSRSSNITRFFESRNEASSVTGAFGVISFNDNNNLLQIRYDASISLSNAQLSIDVKHKISMQKNQLYIDDVLKITAPAATFQTNYSLLIFGFHTPSAKQNVEGVYLLYSFKIYDNGTLVRDYIPVIDQDNVACLYEQVEGKFYYNKGSGAFAAGSTTGSPVSIGNVAREITKGYVGVPASYTPVGYIENSGTQYIDTGFIPNFSDGLKIEVKVQPSTLGSRYAVVTNYNSATSLHFTGEITANNEARLYMNAGTLDVKQAGIVLGENTIVWEYYNGNYKLTVNGVSKTGTYSTSGQNTQSLLFFVDRLFRFSTFNQPIKLFYCKIYSGNTLVRDFIPAINQDNVACLYELVEGKFYYNKGTGTFTAGSVTGQEVALSPVARLCYSARALPDTALFLCHLDNNTINEITGNNTAPYSVTSYPAGKFGQAATIRATQVVSDYAATTTIFSLSDTNLPNAYNVLNGTASPVTATGWFKSNTNDGWIFAYGYGDFKTWGKNGASSYRNGIGVDASGGYLRAKIVYRTSSSPLNTASVTTDVASSVYADGNWHHYAIEVDSTGMNFYFDGVYKCHINKPSNIMSDGFSKRVHFALGDEVMVCGELLYNHRNFTPPDRPYTI